MIETLLGHVETLLLLGCAAGALAGGTLMLALRRPMRVAMALIATMMFLAGIYGLLGMHFIAAFQVLIYVGAVMLFMVYVIMLLEGHEADGARYSRLVVPGAAGLVALFFVLAASVWRPLPSPTAEIGAVGWGIAAFSADFLGEYWLLFELTSVLLVAAVVGAIAAIRVSTRAGAGSRHG